MPQIGAKRFAEGAKRALTDANVVQSEIGGFLKQLASNATFAAKLHAAIDEDNRKDVIKLLKPGCFKKCNIDSLELFPGNLRVKLTVDFKRMRFTIEVET